MRISYGLMIASLILVGCEKARLDQQVKELCAKDGGIRVYETVILPQERFDQWGTVSNYRPTQGENALGREYVFKSETIYFRKGNPEMWREHYQIYRRHDGKLLGEAISYSRRGGDVPGPWHESSYGCPDKTGDANLVKQLFVATK